MSGVSKKNQAIIVGLPDNITYDQLSDAIPAHNHPKMKILRNQTIAFISYQTSNAIDSFVHNRRNLNKKGDIWFHGYDTQIDHSRFYVNSLIPRQEPYNNNNDYNPSSSSSTTTATTSNKLYVKGFINSCTTEDDLKHAFSTLVPSLTISSVRITTPGKAIIAFTTVDTAITALQLAISTNLKVNGCHLFVNFSSSSSSSSSMRQRPAVISPSFKFDEKSNMWYDSKSQFYYDESMQLYIHSITGIRYRYNAMKQEYIMVDERGVEIKQDTTTAVSTGSDVEKTITSSEKRKQPDIEPQKQEQEQQQPGNTPIVFQFKQQKQKKTRIIPSVLLKEEDKIINKEEPISVISSTGDIIPVMVPKLQAVHIQEKQQQQQNNNRWFHYDKKQCLLCKRQFRSIEHLKVHELKSELHKKNINIEEYKKQEHKIRNDAQKIISTKQAEENKKIKFEDMVSKSVSTREKQIASQRSEVPLDSNNIGNKILLKMGYKEGDGLGKYGQGRKIPINDEQRKNSKAGVGAGVSSNSSTIIDVKHNAPMNVSQTSSSSSSSSLVNVPDKINETTEDVHIYSDEDEEVYTY